VRRKVEASERRARRKLEASKARGREKWMREKTRHEKRITWEWKESWSRPNGV
jgi:hypothetical protein